MYHEIQQVYKNKTYMETLEVHKNFTTANYLNISDLTITI